MNINLEEYFEGLRPAQKVGRPGDVEQEFDHKSWKRRATNYPEVEITDEMRVKARTIMPTFYLRYQVRGSEELELYNNAKLKKVPLAPWHIRIYTGYLDMGCAYLFPIL